MTKICFYKNKNRLESKSNLINSKFMTDKENEKNY